MKIVALETFLTNAGIRNYLFLRLRTDSGLIGIGEASLEWQEKNVQTLVHEWVEGRVLGRDPFAHDHLQRIGLEVEQKKQELILELLQSPFATPASRTPARLAFGGLVGRVELLIRLRKGSQQTLELRER